MKNITVKTILAFTLFLCFPIIGSANAHSLVQPLGAGEWDFVYGYSGDLSTNGVEFDTSKQYKSYGGNFKVEIKNIDGNNCFYVQLMEYDPSNADDKVGVNKRVCSKESEATITWDVRNAVDGNNGAELYLRYGHADHNDSYIFLMGYD